MDDKSIEKTTSALNGHGIALDDPTTTCSIIITVKSLI